MSIKFTNTSGYLSNTSIPSDSTVHTIFVRMLSSTGGAGQATPLSPLGLYDAGGSALNVAVQMQQSLNVAARADAGSYISGGTFSPAFDDNVWYDFAVVVNGNSTNHATCYAKRTQDTSWAKSFTMNSMAAFTSFAAILGAYNSAANAYVNFCHYRAWDAALNSSELLSEAASETIVRSSNVRVNTAFDSGSLTSLTGNNWTAASGATVAAGATNPTFGGTKYLKILTHSSAASQSGIEVVAYDAPGGSNYVTGTTRYGSANGKTFEASLEGGKAVLLVPAADVGCSGLSVGATPRALAQNATLTTGMVTAEIVEVT